MRFSLPHARNIPSATPVTATNIDYYTTLHTKSVSRAYAVLSICDSIFYINLRQRYTIGFSFGLVHLGGTAALEAA